MKIKIHQITMITTKIYQTMNKIIIQTVTKKTKILKQKSKNQMKTKIFQKPAI